MTVKEVMQKIINEEIGDIDFCDDYDERAYIAYCGNHWTPKAEEKYARAFNLPVDEESSRFGGNHDIVIVHCETAKDAQALADLLYAMAGYIGEKEYDELFPEPEEDKPEPVRKMFEVVLTDGEILTANRIDLEQLYRSEEEKQAPGFAVYLENGDCIPVYMDQVVRIIGKE